MRVLVTGAAGYIGRHLTAGLGDQFDLRLGDVRPIDDPRFVPLDVADPRQARAAAEGVEAIIHLAIASGHEGEFEDDEFNSRRFDVNVKGTMNILSAAVRAGVERFVFTSSLMVVWGSEPPALVPSDAPGRPLGTYAITKHLGEVLCEDFARTSALSVVCLRIPKPIDPKDPVWQKAPIRPQWLPFPDLIQAYRLALVAPDIGFEIITVVGESSSRRWDLSKAERVLGYRPTCRLEDLGFLLGAEDEPYPP
jgi:nucleoside-diphosphate-sugar epimerase